MSIAILPALLAACQSSWPGPAVTHAPVREAVRCPSTVTAYAGDTVYSVARHCGVSVRELIEINGLRPPYILSGGMRLRVPGNRDYVVRRGDTLFRLARRFHVGFRTLAEMNNRTPPYTIRLGEHLRIPGDVGTAAQSPAVPAGPVLIASPNAVGGASRSFPPPPPRSAEQVSPTPSPRLAEEMPPPAPRPVEETSHDSAPVLAGDLTPPDPRPASPARPPSPPAEPASNSPPPPSHVAEDKPVLPPEPAPVTDRGFMWPVKGKLIAEFGPQDNKGQSNDGINIAAPKGTPVHAAENGVVAYVGNELKGFGNLILIKHAGGWMTAYAHNDRVLVHRGARVKRGEPIATVGATGSVTSPQLHFEMRHGGEAVDPTDYLGNGRVS